MAMVKFLKGLITNLPANPDSNTLYFCTDGALYLGANKIADVTNLSDVQGAIEALQNAGYQNAEQVGQLINNALANYYTKNDVDGKFATKEALKVVTDDYVKAADIANFATDGELAAVDAKFANYRTAANQDLIDEAQDVEIGKKANAADVYTKDAANAQFRTQAQVKAQIEEYGYTTEAALGLGDLAKKNQADLNLDQYTTEAEVNAIVNKVITDAVDGDTLTSLTELVQYLDEHGDEAVEMAAAIETLEGKVEVIEGKPAYNITSTQIGNWNNEVGAKAAAAAAQGEIDALEAVVNNATTGLAAAHTKAQQGIDDAAAALAKANEKTTTAEVKAQIEAYGYATEADLTAAENRVKAIEDSAAYKSGITAEKVASYDEVVAAVAGYGDIVTRNAAEFATAAQGAKADTAVQEIITGTNNGTIKVDGTEVAVKGLGTAAYKAEGYFELAGAASAVQGATTNTVKDCVDAINTINNQNGTTIGTVNNIVSQLTWGTF